jgi:hypothetical protein
LFSDWGVQRGKAPLLGVWGTPQTQKSPKIGGYRGLKETLICGRTVCTRYQSGSTSMQPTI